MQYIKEGLKFSDVRQKLAVHRRVLVRDFFDESVAQSLVHALDGIDWSLSYRDDTGDCNLTGPELRLLAPQQRTILTQRIHRLAEQNFQFSFFTHSIVESAQRGNGDLLSRFARWMGDEPFLSLMRELSGLDDLNRVYAQATMYTRGNFLSAHDDHVDTENRRLAYVINLTRQWRPEWGGMLNFTDEFGNVAESFFPHFNSISLFVVPQTHFVSYVPPFAAGERYAITGWLIAT